VEVEDHHDLYYVTVSFKSTSFLKWNMTMWKEIAAICMQPECKQERKSLCSVWKSYLFWQICFSFLRMAKLHVGWPLARVKFVRCDEKGAACLVVIRVRFTASHRNRASFTQGVLQPDWLLFRSIPPNTQSDLRKLSNYTLSCRYLHLFKVYRIFSHSRYFNLRQRVTFSL